MESVCEAQDIKHISTMLSLELTNILACWHYCGHFALISLLTIQVGQILGKFVRAINAFSHSSLSLWESVYLSPRPQDVIDGAYRCVMQCPVENLHRLNKLYMALL